MLYRNKSSMVTYLFSAYFISVYVSFINDKNCGFVMGFVILATHFLITKQFFVTIFNIKPKKQKGNKKKPSMVKYFFFYIIG